MQLLIATGNAHKLEEIRTILGVDIQLLSLKDFPPLPEPIEDGKTFEENALIKATAYAATLGVSTLADDSGLQVDALDGAPGVHSARYAGTHGDTPANNAKLLANLQGQTNRTARFRCAIAIAHPDGTTQIASGACEGRIIEAPRGDAGFGYDPLFIPNGYDQTFAQLPADVKNQLSHRGTALRKLAPLLPHFLGVAGNSCK